MKFTTVDHSFNLVSLGIALAIGAGSLTPVQAEKKNQDVPEIGWSSRISSMGLDKKKNMGKKYTFYCQSASEDLVHAPVWGTKVYTVNSGICSTAVHSGMIDAEEGGKVTLKLAKGKQFYTGSKKNNVTTKDHTGTDVSYTFVGQPKAVAKKSDEESSKKKREASGLERVLTDGFSRGVERSIEKAIIDILK